MKKPLLIYLDSSDISILSNPNQRTRDLELVEKKLCEWLRDGKIEFRFSLVHVLEAAPIQAEHLELATLRFRYIKRLCGQKCFISPTSLLKNEVLRLANQIPSSESNFLNDSGEWFEMLDEDAFDIRSEILNMPDRETRRKLLRENFDKNGNLKACAKLKLKSLWPKIRKDILEKFPISERDLVLPEKSYLKNGSGLLLWQEIKNSLSDLDRLATWYEMDWDLMSSNFSFLRDSGISFKDIAEVNKDKLKSLEDKQIALGMTDSDVGKSRNYFFEHIRSVVLTNVANKIASHLGASILGGEINWSLAPSLYAHISLAIQNNKQIMTTQLKSKASDYGDYSHAVYLPHVDIFRTDAAASNVIKQIQLPFKTIVVAKLLELPNEIEKQLKN